MWKWLYRLIQCTWGLPQTMAGFATWLRFRGYPCASFGGAVHTRWPGRNGVSLGLFIFTPVSGGDWDGGMVYHEYGHTFQSLMLGPLYLPLIGLPSLIWCSCFKTYRSRKNVPYSAFFTEKWADKLGAWWKRRH